MITEPVISHHHPHCYLVQILFFLKHFPSQHCTKNNPNILKTSSLHGNERLSIRHIDYIVNTTVSKAKIWEAKKEQKEKKLFPSPLVSSLQKHSLSSSNYRFNPPDLTRSVRASWVWGEVYDHNLQSCFCCTNSSQIRAASTVLSYERRRPRISGKICSALLFFIPFLPKRRRC